MTAREPGRGRSCAGATCRLLLGPLILLAVIAAVVDRQASADVIVLANRTNGRFRAHVQPVTSRAVELSLQPREVVPVFTDGRAYVSFDSGGPQKRYVLDANSAYYFGHLADGRVELNKIGLGDDGTSADGRSLPGSAHAAPSVTIAVKILVDEEEPTRQVLWERRLRQRVAKASEILDKHCRLKLKVVAVDRWNSENGVTDFFESLSEFEDEADPFPGELAIGFTSQYQVPRGRVHLGGTRGPFHTHILIREWSQHVGEPERLELLVHELGHYVGASHSPERDSVMRPVLGDRQAVRAKFAIRFDPVNTLVMAMVAEEMRRRNIRKMNDLTVGTKRRLRQIYGGLSETFPADTAAKKYARIVDVATVSPLVAGTRKILREIVSTARSNHKLPPAGEAGQGQPIRRQGDELTELYVRQAAETARTLPDDVAPTAFVLAMGIGLDDSDLLRRLPKVRTLVGTLESGGQRSVRLAFLGEPTMRNRRDLTKHFVASACLASVVGIRSAETLGMAKEGADAQDGGSGFSFADLAANKAGVLFARAVLEKRITLAALAEGFTVEAYMPAVDGLPEGLSSDQLATEFGGQGDNRFQQQLREIQSRVLGLPAYGIAEAGP